MSEPTPLEQELEAITDRAWANVLASDDGRRVAWDILARSGIFQISYTGNADTNFNEGRRSVGLALLNECIVPNGAHLLGDMMAQHADMVERIEAEIEAREQE